jgi:hypothetical protein
VENSVNRRTGSCVLSTVTAVPSRSVGRQGRVQSLILVNASHDENGGLLDGAQVVRNTVEQALLAESVGIDSFNIAEHYRAELMDTASHVMLAAIASRTSSSTTRKDGRGGPKPPINDTYDFTIAPAADQRARAAADRLLSQPTSARRPTTQPRPRRRNHHPCRKSV